MRVLGVYPAAGAASLLSPRLTGLRVVGAPVLLSPCRDWDCRLLSPALALAFLIAHPFSSVLSPLSDAFFLSVPGIWSVLCYPDSSISELNGGSVQSAILPQKANIFSSDTVGKWVCGVGRGGDYEEDEVVSVGHQVAAGEMFPTSFSFRCDCPN